MIEKHRIVLLRPQRFHEAAGLPVDAVVDAAMKGEYSDPSTTPSTLELTILKCRIREGLAGPQEPALLTSGGRMPERSQHRVSGGLDGRSERPAMGSGQP